MPECKKLKKIVNQNNKPSRVDRLITWLEEHRYRLDKLQKGHIEAHFAGDKLSAKLVEGYDLSKWL